MNELNIHICRFNWITNHWNYYLFFRYIEILSTYSKWNPNWMWRHKEANKGTQSGKHTHTVFAKWINKKKSSLCFCLLLIEKLKCLANAWGEMEKNIKAFGIIICSTTMNTSQNLQPTHQKSSQWKDFLHSLQSLCKERFVVLVLENAFERNSLKLLGIGFLETL